MKRLLGLMMSAAWMLLVSVDPGLHAGEPASWAREVAFVGVNVVPIDREGVLNNQTVIVRAGRIAAVGPADSTPVSDGALQVEARDKYLMPGLAEGRQLTGRQTPEDIAAFYLDQGAQQVVVKLGPEGAYFAQRGGASGIVPGRPVERVVDTVGAGDGFAVGVISGLFDGLTLAQATARGNAIGARVVQFPGDAQGLPTREELAAAGG